MINTNTLVNLLLVFILVLLSGSILFVGYVIPVYLVGFIIAFFSVINKKINLTHFKLFTVSFILFVFILLVNFVFSSSNSFGNYFTVISLGLYSLLVKLSFDVRKQNFLPFLYTILKYFVLHSLVGFIVTQFCSFNLVELGSSGYMIKTFNYLFYYNSQFLIAGITFFRNQGFFWEPGVLSVFANIFLFLSLFEFKNRKNAMFASLSIVSTFSTTGIFLLCLQLYTYLRINKLEVRVKSLLIILIVFTSVLFISNLMEKKKFSDSTVISSLGMRKLDLYSGFMVAINNPFFGVGLNKKAFIKERDKFLPKEFYATRSLIKNRGNTNSFLQILYSFGLIIGLLILYFFYKQEIVKKHKKLFYLIILICLSSEPLWVTPFFLILLFSGMRTYIRKYNII